MKEMNELEVMSTEEMGNLRGGGHWVYIGGEWIWIESYGLDLGNGEED